MLNIPELQWLWGLEYCRPRAIITNDLGFPWPPLSLFEYEATSLRLLGRSFGIYEWILVPTIRWHLNHRAEFSAFCCDLPTWYYSNVLKVMLVYDFLCSVTIQTSWNCSHIGVGNLFLDHGRLLLAPEKNIWIVPFEVKAVFLALTKYRRNVSQHNQGYIPYIHANIIENGENSMN